MSRLPRLLSCLLLAALAAGLGAPAAAQDAARQEAPAKRQATGGTQPRKPEAKPKAHTAKSAQARNQAGKALLGKKQGQGSGLSKDDLSRPYSADASYGPPAPPKESAGADNATGLNFDLEPKKRPFAQKQKQEDSPINFRIGRDKVTDPLTGMEVGPKPDASAAKENIKNMDLKGALEKSGGKAEVQVDILKF
ncbi:MAG: hypothetical protein HY916_00980 [Desulfovibrio sp.]|jgi:hypothetical protein|nr:hypothetical protein [Desulfovibrio sp.]